MTSRVLRDLVARAHRGVFGRCAYCGRHCFGRACDLHRDLVQNDPLFNPDAAALREETTAASRPHGG